MKMKKAIMFLAIAIVMLGTGIKTNAANMITLNPNVKLKDHLSSDELVKYYQFTVDKSGYFTISFEKIDPTIKIGYGGWRFVLYDMDGNELRSFSTDNKYTTDKFSFKKGNQYYIMLKEKDSWANTEDVDFYLSVNTVEDKSWEVEDNNDIAHATVLTAGSVKKATLWNIEDMDYYKYVVDKTGYFTFTLTKIDPTIQLTYGGYGFKMYDADGNELDYYNKLTNTTTTQVYNFPKGTELYFRIYRNDSWANVVDVEYSVKIDSVEDGNWEIENMAKEDDTWSNRIKGVRTLSKNNTYGTLYRSFDNDVYKVVANSTGKMNLMLNPNDVETNLGYGYKVQIYNSKGTLLTTVNYIKSKTNFGYYVKKGTYYVVLSGYDHSALTGNKYTITCSCIKKTVPSMASKKLKYGSNTVKWSKVKNVDGYEIRLCTNKKFKAKNTTVYTTDSKEKSYKFNTWSVRGKYYVKVRAYFTDINGNKIYGKYTKVKKITIK